jgi:thiol-disulfide isomerase/thioredoxin
MSRLFTAVLLLFGIHSTAQGLNQKIQDSTRNTLIMINQCTRDSVVNFPDFKPMYDSQYADYTPDAAIIKDLKPRFEGLKIAIIMGTWCIDSKLQVPHFYKILDEAGAAENQITLICVNEQKQTTDGSIDQLHVDRVPTFIVKRDGKELGRIVEFPNETLEKDLLAILSSK